MAAVYHQLVEVQPGTLEAYIPYAYLIRAKFSRDTDAQAKPCQCPQQLFLLCAYLWLLPST